MTQQCPACARLQPSNANACEACGSKLPRPETTPVPGAGYAYARQLLPPVLVAAGGITAYAFDRSVYLLAGAVAAVFISLTLNKRPR